MSEADIYSTHVDVFRVDDWGDAPPGYDWRAVDSDGKIYWLKFVPDFDDDTIGPVMQWDGHNDLGFWAADLPRIEIGQMDMTGLDWCNSLRHRPQAVR